MFAEIECFVETKRFAKTKNVAVKKTKEERGIKVSQKYTSLS